MSNKQTVTGASAQKVVADMSQLRSSPLNLVGTNLTQGYGGFLRRDAWKNSKNKLMDPGKALRNRGLAVVETSCDENESMLEQMYDDDKMELMCHEGLTDYVDFELARYGQVRSPYQVEMQDDIKSKGKQISLGIDGEFYEIRNCSKITFQIDKTIPKLKILKRASTSGADGQEGSAKNILEETRGTF